MIDYNALIAELVEIEDEQDRLKTRKAAVERAIISAADDELKDTKFKTVSHCDRIGNRVTYTVAQSLSVDNPEYLKQLFGKAYKDIVTEEPIIKCSIKKDIYKNMLIALYHKDLCGQTVDEFWNKLPVTDNIKKTLRRKLKGTDFAKDKDALIKIGGFNEADASDYAYFYSEAVSWSAVESVCRLAGMEPTQENLDTVIQHLIVAISVTETPKLKLERNKDAGTEESQTDIRAGE